MATSVFLPEHVSVLFVSTEAASNSGTDETDLISYAMPANTLNADGQAIRIRATVDFAANANTKTVQVYFGSTAFKLNPTTTAPNNVWGTAEFLVVRLGAASQVFQRVQGSVGTANQGVTNTAITEDLTGALTIKLTGQSGTASDDITSRLLLVEWLPAGASS